MSESEWNAQNHWQPSPLLRLSRLYHPAIGKGHREFEKLPATEQQLVTAVQKQYERWSHRPYFKHGLSNRLIAILNGYGFASKLAACMMVPNLYSKHLPFSRCILDWFCEFCAYLKGQDLLKKYGGAWQADAWFEMVISLEVGVCPADPEHDFMGDLLDAMVAVVKRLQDEKRMLGYVAWLEIKVHQFYPYLICTPHVHVLLRCDCPPDRDAFAKAIAGEWTSRKLTADPDLFLEPVKNEAHFYELLTYIKPIDLLGPYDRGYQAAKAAGKVELLHREVREFFEALTVETTGYQEKWDKRIQAKRPFLITRRRFLYGGNCHGSSSHPLGLKEAVRRTREHQEAIRAKVEIAREAEERCQEADEHQAVA